MDHARAWVAEGAGVKRAAQPAWPASGKQRNTRWRPGTQQVGPNSGPTWRFSACPHAVKGGALR